MFLKVRDGDSATSPLLKKLCGAELPEPIISTYNVLWLKFVTDSSLQNRGFLANYTSINTGIHSANLLLHIVHFHFLAIFLLSFPFSFSGLLTLTRLYQEASFYAMSHLKQ